MIAVSAGKLETVKLLLAKGANITAANGNGQTSLHYAASKNYSDVREQCNKSCPTDVRNRLPSCCSSTGHR